MKRISAIILFLTVLATTAYCWTDQDGKAPFKLLSEREKLVAIFYYMQGWNSGIDAVYATEKWREANTTEEIIDGKKQKIYWNTVPVGGFTGINRESVSTTLSNDEWDWEGMHYKDSK